MNKRPLKTLLLESLLVLFSTFGLPKGMKFDFCRGWEQKLTMVTNIQPVLSVHQAPGGAPFTNIASFHPYSRWTTKPLVSRVENLSLREAKAN